RRSEDRVQFRRHQALHRQGAALERCRPRQDFRRQRATGVSASEDQGRGQGDGLTARIAGRVSALVLAGRYQVDLPCSDTISLVVPARGNRRGNLRPLPLPKLRRKQPPTRPRRGSQAKPQVIRYGHREIATLGLGQGFWSDLYHRAMAVHWPVFFGSAAALFVTLNAIFGFLYWLGHEPIANAEGNGPLAYFYFSIETLATVGYGDMHPQ